MEFERQSTRRVSLDNTPTRSSEFNLPQIAPLTLNLPKLDPVPLNLPKLVLPDSVCSAAPEPTPFGDLSRTVGLVVSADQLLTGYVPPRSGALGAAGLALGLLGEVEQAQAEGLTGGEAAATVLYRSTLDNGLNLGFVTMGAALGGPLGAIIGAGAGLLADFLTQPLGEDLREK